MLRRLRVVQTGVQVLSAFLLTLPFTPRFATLDTAGKALYGVSLVAAAVSTALVIAPVSYRQRVGGGRALANVIKVAVRLAEAGLATWMIAAVYLASWYLLPLWHRLRTASKAR